MTSDADLIQALTEAHQAATKGEWQDTGVYAPRVCITVNNYGRDIALAEMFSMDNGERAANSDLIVLAHNSMPRLLQLAKEALAAREVLQEIAAKHKALEGDIFCLTQPDKGGVFGAYDDLGIIARDALLHLSEARKED